jgi:hypothetical protein
VSHFSTGFLENQTVTVFDRRLHYLNLGDPRGTAYEVAFDGDKLLDDPDHPCVLARARMRLPVHKDFDADMVLVNLSEMELFWELKNFVEHPLDSDGVPTVGRDTDFWFSADPQKYKGLAQEIFQELKCHENEYGPDLTFDSDGTLKYASDADILRFYAKPRFAALMTKAVLTMAAAVAKTANQLRPGTPLVFALNPVRNFLGHYEDSGIGTLAKMTTKATFDFAPMRKGLEAEGFKVLDLVSDCRSRATDFFPMCQADIHLSPNGIELLSFLTAEQLRPLFAPAATDASQRPVPQP